MAYAFNNDKSKSELDNAMFITAETNSVMIPNEPPVGSIHVGTVTAPTKSGYTPIAVIGATGSSRIVSTSLHGHTVYICLQNVGGAQALSHKATVLYVATKYIRQ